MGNLLRGKKGKKGVQLLRVMCIITVLLHDLVWSLHQVDSGHLEVEEKYLLWMISL